MWVVTSHGPGQVDSLQAYFYESLIFSKKMKSNFSNYTFHPLTAASSFFNGLLCSSVFSQRVLTVANQWIKHLWRLTVTVSSTRGRSSLFPLGEPWTSIRMIRMPMNSKPLKCSHFFSSLFTRWRWFDLMMLLIHCFYL